MIRRMSCALLLSWLSSLAMAHEGPDPMVNWNFAQKFWRDGQILAQQGPNLKILGQPTLEEVDSHTVLRLDGRSDHLMAVGEWAQVRQQLPSSAMTIATWVAVDETLDNGGIVCAMQDNGGFEKGWVLGYNRETFSFGLSTTGAADDDGMMTYLTGATKIQPGRWYHLVAVYDGATMQLFVDGRLDGESKVQHGAVLYPENTKLVVGGYVDQDEKFLHHGRLAGIEIYDVAAKDKWISHDFQHRANWTKLAPAKDPSLDFQFLVKPYLQYGTTDSMRVMCELAKPGRVRVEFGETSQYDQKIDAVSTDGLLHTATLSNLKAETGYYYQVVVQENGSDRELRGEQLSFQTASLSTSPFAFVVIGDTQGNPQVNGKLAQMAWALRPNFLVLPGDLVDDGTKKEQWLHEFFASMHPLISRVPLYPVLGNHERNADHYYRYMDLPAPEYYYAFKYGNAMFYMLDSNKKLDSQSEQYLWLESQLKELQRKREQKTSDVVWTFVSFHHPVFSSDENDYGDLWKGKSTWGDLRLRELTNLFDQYEVDIVWNGHIHSYERTWPLLKSQAQESGGTTYIVTGGGGGGLEQAGPIRPWFQNNVRRGHHFVFAAVNGATLEFKAFDLEGRLFDSCVIRKQVKP